MDRFATRPTFTAAIRTASFGLAIYGWTRAGELLSAGLMVGAATLIEAALELLWWRRLSEQIRLAFHEGHRAGRSQLLEFVEDLAKKRSGGHPDA